jgi:ribosomal protein S18 acetylase RimI-like enzyme
MTSRITIRPARPDDAPLAAAVFRLSLDHLADYLFGADGRATEVALMRLFSQNATRLSLSVARHLPRALGWGMFGFVARGLRLAGGIEAEADEYYVSNLAVLPAAQGHGLGKHLLLHADEQARALGLIKCSLLVALDNEMALRLYKRQGYKIVFTKRDKNPHNCYHRMVKKLITEN